ncbi:hypothetical protein [Thermomonospora umbrina]|uniref:Uncharacterized protein n=1 Tax=Thermomonospora umbrina TaxID=111806 RepID=A0A3D9SWE1_9ACTN|nr:hypothetical protein [Thermomonospora umbrina]REF00270.1 hypothetical protein DFJ69_5799 [Thermomonospora umbrina]
MNRHLRCISATPSARDRRDASEIVDGAIERRRFHDDGTLADTRWNGWRLDAAHQQFVLESDDGHITYAVDLLRCDQSAAVLDAVTQAAVRDWSPRFDGARVVAGLVFAFDDVIGLQANVCGWGVDQVLSGLRIRERIYEFVRRFEGGARS